MRAAPLVALLLATAAALAQGAPCEELATTEARLSCCQAAMDADQLTETWCVEALQQLYSEDSLDAGSTTAGAVSAADMPFVAYIKSPMAEECAGSLVAPGYVLTAASCVFADGAAAPAADVSVWVGGKWQTVSNVLVNLDKAQFSEFTNPTTEPSWDIAMLELSEDSEAAPVALPASDVPAAGAWVTQTAWEVPESTILTAQINQWDGCPAGYLWADQLCAGGAGFLQACPADKGAPLLEEDTLVGIASGPSCDGAVDNYGAFVKVADKGILEQVSVWLNNRGGVGLSPEVQEWMIAANKYIYES